MDWEDQPLFEVAQQEPKERSKKPARTPTGVRWETLKHRRWMCELCVKVATSMQHPYKAEALRHEGSESVAYCGMHAGDQKVQDEREGLWRRQR